ncbi:MAG: DUF4382 domain-containing protein, partial [bacterium]
MNKKVFLIIMVLALGIVLTGCEGLFTESDGSGTLALNIADRPVNNVEKVLVTIDEVQVNREGESWETINDFEDEEGGEKEFDLMTLRFDKDLLGEELLPSGTYEQIRLIVAADEEGSDPTEAGKSKVVYKDETTDDDNIFIPSGTQTGLKINHNFEIQEDTITELTLDVNVSEMLHAAGNSGKIILKPTAIDILDEIISGEVEGRVVDHNGDPIDDQDVIVEAINEDDEVAADTVATTEPTYERDEDGEIITDEDGNKVVDKPAGSFRLRGLPEDGIYSVDAYIEDEDGNKIYEAEEIIEGVEVEAGEVTELEDNLVID